MNVVLVIVGIGVAGAVGSVLRHEILTRTSAPATVDRARAVAVVNLVGALLLAIVGVAPVSTGWRTVLGVGLCGSLTTFSTWVVEAWRAREGGRHLRVIASVDLAGQLAVGVGVVLLVLATSAT